MHSKRYTRFSLFILVVAVALLLPGAIALARSGAGYGLTWWTVDGGSAVGAGSPDPYSLGGTAGQPDAGHTLSNGGYALTGGFWAGAGPAAAPGTNALYLPLALKN